MTRQEPSQGGYLSSNEEESGTADLTAWGGSKRATGPSLCPVSHMYGETHKQTGEVQGMGCDWELSPAQVKGAHFLPLQSCSMAKMGWSS